MKRSVYFLLCVVVTAHASPLQTPKEYSKILMLSEIETGQQDDFTAEDQELRYLKNAEQEEYLFVGGRNNVYKIRKNNMSLVYHKTFNPVTDPVDTNLICEQYKANPDYVCQNYIKVIEEIAPDELLVCGSNSFYPACWICPAGTTVNTPCNGSHSDIMENFIAQGPDEKSAWLYNNITNKVFAGADQSSSSDTTFAKYTLTTVLGGNSVLQIDRDVTTDSSNTKWLNRPSFVGSPIRFKGKVYFFYRETAVEYINAGKIIYSRVAQVCEDDVGGQPFVNLLQGVWLSFLKARLNCSIQGDFPFYFDEIHDIFQSPEDESIIYAVFTTAIDGPAASAVCIYNMNNIAQTFDASSFKGQQNLDTIWLPRTQWGTDPRPGSCGSYPAPDSSKTNFLRDYALMNLLIPNTPKQVPDVMDVDSSSPAIVVLDKRFKTIVGIPEAPYHVFMIGTDEGTVLKAYYNPADETGAVVAEIQISERNDIQQMSLYKEGGENYVFVSARSKVQKVPLKFCQVYTQCSDCVNARDIHCEWNNTLNTCITSQPKETFELVEDCSMCPTCPDSNQITIVQKLPKTERCSEKMRNIISMDFLAVSSRNIHLHCSVNITSSGNHNMQFKCEKGVTNNVDYYSCRVFSGRECSFGADVNVTISCSGDCSTEEVTSSCLIINDKSDVRQSENDMQRFWIYQEQLSQYLYDLNVYKNETLKNCKAENMANIHTCPAPVFENEAAGSSCPAA